MKPKLNRPATLAAAHGSATCPGCGKRVRICIPKGGDGSVDVYVRHDKRELVRCEWSRREVSPNNPDHRQPPTETLKAPKP